MTHAPPFRVRRWWLWLVVVAVLGCAASITADWPGHFPPDAIEQLAQGKSGLLNGWHPPVMAALLGLADRLIPGAPLFIVMDAGLFFGALTALAGAGRPTWLTVIVLAILAASPLVLIYQGMVVTDVLFADAALAGFAAMACAARVWDRRGARYALIALSLGFLSLAALARQNGFIVALGGGVSLAGVAMTKARGRRSFAVALLATLGVMAAVAGVAAFALAAHGDRKPEAARQLTVLALFDLAGEARRDPRLDLSQLARNSPALEGFIRRDAAPAYDPMRVDSLARLAGWNAFVDPPSPWAPAQWRRSMAASPGLYLATRWGVFRQVFLTPDVAACAPVLVGVDGGIPRLLRAAGISARETDKDDWDSDYATTFLGTPVFSHLFYAALAVALLAWAARDARRDPQMIVAAGLLGSALVFAASFFPIAIACDYRYLYFLDVAGMAALVQRTAAGPRASTAATTVSKI